MWRPAQGFLTQRVTTTLQQNADYLAVGSFLGARPLGFYSMAYRLSELPSNAIAETVARVTFPAFAQLKAAGRPFDDSFLTALRFVALTAVPLGVVLSATAEPFTRAVFGAKWEPMIGVLTVLGLWGAARPLQSTGEALLNSIGVAGLVGRLYVGVTLVVVPAMIVVAQLAGIRTVAAVLLVMAIGLAGVVARLVAAHAAVSVGRQWKAVRPALIGAAGMWVAGRAVAEAPLGVPAGVQLVLAVGAALAAYAVLVRALDPALTAHVRAGLLVLRRR
jgi:O-antigen/teichoic acid export membrane protein